MTANVAVERRSVVQYRQVVESLVLEVPLAACCAIRATESRAEAGVSRSQAN